MLFISNQSQLIASVKCEKCWEKKLCT